MKFGIVAYPDEEGNKRQEATIEAASRAEAQKIAWEMFPEHHEVGVYEAK